MENRMTIAGSRREMETVCFDIHIDYLNRLDQKNRFGAWPSRLRQRHRRELRLDFDHATNALDALPMIASGWSVR
jgi:hypothetical protein